MRISDWSSDVCSSDLLTLTGAVTYLDTRIREYTGYDGVPTIVDFAGSDLPFAPRWNYSVDANFSPPIGANGKAILGATVHGQSSQDTVVGGDSFTYPVSPTTIFLPGITHPYKTNPYGRSEEHTSELQSLMRNSYAVFCL